MRSMKGRVIKIITALAGVAILYMPAAPAYAFQHRIHNEGPMIFPGQSHGPSPFDDEGVGRALLPPMGQDRARQAMQQGEILPLSDIRRQVRDQFGGKIVGVDLVQGDEDALHSPPWVYDIKVLSPEGRVLFVHMDASNGRVLGVKGQR